jgi:acyl carrier protein
MEARMPDPAPAAVLDGIIEVLRGKLAVAAPLSRDTDVLRDLQLDSIQMLTLIVELENRFRLCFEPGDEEGLCTLGDIAARIEGLRAEEAP